MTESQIRVSLSVLRRREKSGRPGRHLLQFLVCLGASDGDETDQTSLSSNVTSLSLCGFHRMDHYMSLSLIKYTNTVLNIIIVPPTLSPLCLTLVSTSGNLYCEFRYNERLNGKTEGSKRLGYTG